MLIASNIPQLIQTQRQFFATGKTQDIQFRLEQLKQLKTVINEYETEILHALQKDLRKPDFEGYLAEIRATIAEINYTLKHLIKWVKKRKVSLPIEQLPATGWVQPQPRGVVLIISPWNYPFSLAIIPLIGAIAAGNCAIIKPSEMTPTTSRIIAEIIERTFDSFYLKVIEGGKKSSQELLGKKFDYIFFTGSPSIGKIVMESAAKYLTPVTLELGGKTPCIVETKINLKETAKRITWGKFINAGQTCVAPDYLLVNQQIKTELIKEICQVIKEFYGNDPAQSPDYARIINQHHFERLIPYLNSGKILIGGQINPEDYYISPTVMDQVSAEDPIMKDEIFGPILPVLTYKNIEEAIAFINERPKPLALYLFSNDQKQQQTVLEKTISGGVCINDTIMHLGVPELPFGGVENSGIGSYHGQASFETFSYYRSVLKRSFWLETNLRFPPYYDKLKWVKRLLG
ncbi:aldehyde dehydrogenase [Crocosphaera sp. UHCC 0190]|uniref:aldehyde dehydrogenase n=1 Tax=Crocosphaera sp. UHCC 0190 TaxID=3110246 RepID=UPI002B1FE012|nr:aldehyde dehydrogenase [Crocosphaera sp. UHCC 0190]MEA5511235.1 aldehyde dehydrogenase [Crocosphaera sp. UHCC 0190]